MDATKTHLNRIAFIFLAVALGIAAPWSAQAQVFSPNTYTVNPLAVPGGSAVTVTGSEDNIGPAVHIAFSATSISYNGDPAWLQVGNDQSCTGLTPTSYTTPSSVGLSAECYAKGLSTGSHTAVVHLTDSSNPSDTATITVTIVVGSGSGGSGTLSAYSSSCGNACVSASAQVGASTSATVTLSTSSVASISYSTSPTPASWLTVSNYAGSVSSASPATLYLSFNGAGYSTAQELISSLTVYYNGNSSSLQVGVTFYVGGGGSTGTLALSQSTVDWSYITSGTLPGSQVVYIENSTASTYGLTFSAYPAAFLTANGSLSNTAASAYPISDNPITLAPISNVVSGLATGTYYEYVTVTDSNGRSAMVTVQLAVNTSSSSGVLSVSQNPVAINGTYLGGTVQTVVYVTSTVSGTLNLSISTSGLSLSTTSTAITANTQIPVTIYGNPSSLPATTYSGSLTLLLAPTLGTTSQLSVPATFTISGNTTTPTSGATVAPSTLQFNFEQGTNTLQPQSLSINGTTGGSDNYTISAPSQSWLETGSSSGSAPAVVEVFVSPGSLPVGTSSAYFTVSTTIAGYTSAVQVTVNVTVTANGVPVLVVQTTDGGSINLSYTGGSANPAAQALYLSASDGSAQAFTATPSASWITLSAGAGTTPASLSATINASGLPNGVNSGYITFSGSFGTTTVPVEVYVTGSSTTSTGVLTLSASTLTFNAVSGGSAPANQTLSVSASTTITFSASASGSSGGINWLSIQPYGSLSTNQTLTVSVANTSSLPIGTYPGYIYLTTSSGTQTVNVTLNVTSTSTLSASPSALTFSYTTGATAPTGQTVSVTASGSTPVNFTVAYSTTSGGSWLILTNTSGNNIASGATETTGFSFVASVNPTNLPAGPYSGTITLTPSGGTAFTIPVTLTVTSGSTVSASPTSLSFTYQVGAATPAAQSISATGAGNAALAFTASATTTTGGNWLAVTPTSGNTPASLSVAVAPASLTAGTYNGTITVAGTGSAGGSTMIAVTLTVTAPLPTITSVVNGASFASGKIAPGEVITISGTALGPSNALGTTLTSAAKVSTTLGTVSVSIGGYAAPLLYAGSTQINCVVPYEVASLVNPPVIVTFAGQTSNATSPGAASTAPAIFTQNGSGSGPGAVLNASGTVNGSSNPAAKGSTIVIYMTGEGQTLPTGVTGSVTGVNTSGSGPLTPQPLLLVAVTIGGQPATVSFYGEAPGLVAGVMQVNAIVPAAAASGTDSLVVSVGGNPSQSGVTVAVQ
ncbi:MAG: IPT/TIG domain-containing protein [Bryobacteraceae bacterium]|jgi:uncharacterized protein (TIGR03437 family)